MIVGYIILGIYLVALSYVTIYCLLQFHLLIHYQKHHRNNVVEENQQLDIDNLPFVTIQLPIYNEKYVTERLIDNITKLDYPKDRFEIHVLDDSTDETIEIALEKINHYKKLGFNIEHMHRDDRSGYKAGALKAATDDARGEFIAIFDADFLPNADFLRKTIPSFNDPKVGVVQTRWDHINEHYSLLTRMQAFQLNVHFTVEQQGRESADYLLQFNGTAGLWRKEAIMDAGGWEADTLTEDLDLSYRAQLKGWKIVYLEEVGSPAELPSEIAGLKSQQFRWMKGGAETAKKMLPTVWGSDLGMKKKINATLHLLSSTIFIFVYAIGVFSVPLLFYITPLDININILTIFMVGLLSIMMVYYVANANTSWKGESFGRILCKFIFIFPIFLAISMGLSLHNSIAVIQGYLGKKSAFVRTPKYDIRSFSDKVINKAYLGSRLNWTAVMEGLMVLYFLWAIYQGYRIGNGAFFIFHFMLVIGYGTIFYYSVLQRRQRK